MHSYTLKHSLWLLKLQQVFTYKRGCKVLIRGLWQLEVQTHSCIVFSRGNFQQMTLKFTVEKLVVILNTSFLNLDLSTCCAGNRMCLGRKFWDASFKKCVKKEILPLLKYLLSPRTQLVLSFSCSKTNTASEIELITDLMCALWIHVHTPSLSTAYLLPEEAVEYM